MQKVIGSSGMLTDITINRALAGLINDIDSFGKQIVFGLFKKVVMRTPVDTGALRSNWFPSVNTPSNEMRPDSTNSGGKLAEVHNFVFDPKRKVWEAKFYLANNLPYAAVVEFGLYPNPPKKGTGKTVNGYSRQAPSGMARISIVETSDIVATANKAASSGGASFNKINTMRF